MAKYKLAGSKREKPPSPRRGLLPCAVIILIGFLLIFLLFYYSLGSGNG